MTKIICEVLLYVLLFGIGAVCLRSMGEVWEDFKGLLQDLREPGALTEVLGAAMVVGVPVFLMFVL